jgi:hypothetical protein
MNGNANPRHPASRFGLLAGLALVMLSASLAFTGKAWAQVCPGAGGTFTADVVLFDTGMLFNRLGAQNPNWMMYALAHDTVDGANNPVTAGGLDTPGKRAALAGNVFLRPDKRPRPLVLRIPADSCLEITFSNLLTPAPSPFNAPVNPNNCPAGANQAQCVQLLFNDNQVASRHASVHIAGMQVVSSSTGNAIDADGTNVGANASPGGIVPSGGQITYTVYAQAEGAFLMTSHGATFGGEATGGNAGVGAFGMVAVQPKDAVIYRSQVTEEEFRLADPDGNGIPDYEAVYPNQAPWTLEGKALKPILNMMDGMAIYHSEINAIVAYKDGIGAFTDFPASTYPLESQGAQNPSVPNRLQAFRDFASVWHDENAVAQAFPAFFSRFATPAGVDQNPLAHALHGVRDSFMINYGSGGIGSEIIANRLGVGPMYDCLGCAYEEFFLTSFTVGDPAMIVDIPANVGLETCNPLLGNLAPCDANFIGKKATEAFYPEDPANIHHSYTGDKTKFRNVHAGPKEQHIFHLHNHQWLFNANDDNSNYLDAQGIGPGSSYTYEINFGGTGNRNKTAGDAIFHCHFYPHFAQGMWYHIRVHDVREIGTLLAVTNAGATTVPNVPGTFHDAAFALQSGRPAAGARATPDGEIVAGTPIPAVVPLPGKALAPVPAGVTIVAKDVDGDGNADSSQVNVSRADLAAGKNPGYPFWIAGMDCNDDVVNCETGIVGQRPPTPQLDMVTVADAKGLLGLLGGTPGIADPFYQSFCPGGVCAAGQDFADSFVNAAGGFDGGLPRHALDGCKAIIAQLVAVGPDLIPGSGDELPAGTVATGCSVLDPAFNAALTAGHPIYATAVSRLDFHKEVLLSKAVFYPEAGTDVEKAAMAAHAVRTDAGGFVLNGGPPVPGAPYNEPCVDDQGDVLYTGVTGDFFDGSFGMSNTGASPRNATNPFTYKAANIQIDAVFNKVGYHYPQQRIIALWNDVLPTIAKTKAPEPFVMRLNTFDCAKYLHSNLVPKEFEVDDYQVRTPTDIIGQHIHLPKWDLTTADGAANGWNYEDGTLSPGMVQERIHAINDGQGGLPDGMGGFTPLLVAYPTDPDFPSNAGFPEWNGARVTIQRWFADPVYNVAGDDRGLGIIFTHDHYGPSTFQQIGLYSTLLVQPAGATWKHNETGTLLATRTDGGPTSWQAAIEPSEGGAVFEPFREFYFEYSDFQHAYEAGVYVGAGPDGRPTPNHVATGNPIGETINAAWPVTPDSFRNAMNPSFRQQAVNGPGGSTFPDIVRFPAVCPDGSLRPCPEAITADDSGMLVVNYRNEPVGLRVFDPNRNDCPDSALNNGGCQTAGFGGDLAFALATPPLLAADATTPIAGQPPANAFRAIPQMNVQPLGGDVGVPAIPIFPTGTQMATTFPPGAGEAGGINTGAIIAGDPYTPMLRVFPGDLVKLKVQTGATEHEHSATVHGVKWLQAGSGHGAAPNSGWRNSQNHGISEQISYVVPLNSDPNAKRPNLFDPLRGADYMYTVDSSQDGYWSGMWGIMRSYVGGAPDLYPLPGGFDKAPQIANRRDFVGVCPAEPGQGGNRPPANLRSYDVIAITANELLGNALGATLVPADASADMHMGVQPNAAGGTLVYNPRGGDGANSAAQFLGPLHDPTALLFVRADDLEPDPAAGGQGGACNDSPGAPGVANPVCQVRLKAYAPLEPLVLRANAGDCVEVRLFNRLDEQVPDLAGWNTLLQMVIRNREAEGQNGEPPSVTTFNNNLIRPSSFVGLHAQLVEYDITQHDGTVVGGNIAGGAVVGPIEGDKRAGAPFNAVTYRWYAGDLSAVRDGSRVGLVATPIEFGGSNLSPADKMKQGQKAMIGALVIEPKDSTWPDALASLTDTERDRQQGDPNVTRKTRADVTVTCAVAGPLTCPDGQFDDLVVALQKGLNHRYGDGTAVENIAGEGGAIPEDSHDAGQKGVNYGTEPAWYRFGLRASTPFGRGPDELGNQPDAWKMYHNVQAGNEDPATPVYDVATSAETRMRLLEPTGVGRGTTFTMHGHIWQRDPYVCPDDTTDGLMGKCPNVPLDQLGELVGQQAAPSIGKNPIGMPLGGQESVTPAQHFEIRLENAGGAYGIAGDYLFRDQASFGNTDGIWGLLRVGGPPPEPDSGGGSGGGKGGGKKKK